MKTYFDFAENDYRYFITSYENGIVANAMAGFAQEICEKYMKHMIDQYYKPHSKEEASEWESALRTHNLVKLMRFLSDRIDVHFSKETQKDLRAINGYYFTARYPGDESIEIEKDDIELCADAVKSCRNEILEQIKEMEKKLSVNKEKNVNQENKKMLENCFGLDALLQDTTFSEEHDLEP